MPLELACELIRRRSVTPDDAGCQELLAERLSRAGFRAERLHVHGVDNIFLCHGKGAPVFSFLGHTDVVPTGPLEQWHSDPFSPEVRDGYLYGRGAADMKGSVAAMVTALETFVQEHPAHPGTAALMLTSDEEGMAVNGTRKLVAYLAGKGIHVDWCLVGEPSSRETVGDVIKNGRRGSLTGVLTVSGVQGHVAYPDLADNPVHRLAPALARLCAEEWDRGNEFYPPTSFQISNIHAGTGADNVIPGAAEVLFNFRYSTAVTEDELVERMERILSAGKLRYRIDWRPSSKPFLTAEGPLLDAVKAVLREHLGRDTEVSTAGGTSDGRFLAPAGAQVVELGPVNETIHKVNECVRAADLEALSGLYAQIVTRMLGR